MLVCFHHPSVVLTLTGPTRRANCVSSSDKRVVSGNVCSTSIANIQAVIQVKCRHLVEIVEVARTSRFFFVGCRIGLNLKFKLSATLSARGNFG